MNVSRRAILLTFILAAGLTPLSRFSTLGLATEPQESTITSSTFSKTITTTITTISSSFKSTATLTLTNVTTQYSYTGTVTTGVTSLYVVTATTSTSLTATQTSTSTTTSIGLPTPPTCPIAAVVAGTPLEPYANSLRMFRNDQILKTSSGRAFMLLFNSWYYGWAPSVASAAVESNGFADLLRLGLVPLFGILYASYYTYFGLAPINVEVGAISAGMLAASLIGLFYLAPCAYLTLRLLRPHRTLHLFGKALTTAIALMILGSGLLTVWAYLLGSFAIIGLGTAILVMSMVTLGSIAGIRVIGFLQPSIHSPAIRLSMRSLK